MITRYFDFIDFIHSAYYMLNKALGISKYNAPRILYKLYSSQGISPEALIFGDSVFERVSKHDKDTRTLGVMTVDALNGRMTANYIAHSAYHSGIYYLLVHLLKNMPTKPRILIMPVNMRSFSPQWDLNPQHQCVEHVLQLKESIHRMKVGLESSLLGIDIKNSRETFLRTEINYPNTSFRYIYQFINTIASTPTTDAEKEYRAKQIFIFHYMHPLKAEHRKLVLFKRAVELARSLGINVFLYITPINYQAGKQFVGSEFLNVHDSNVRVVRKVLMECDNLSINTNNVHLGTLIFKDYSMLLGREYFFSADNPTEHLNENGRKLLSKMIVEQI